jgi:hopanoid biosynthesis associated protein HpnK
MLKRKRLAVINGDDFGFSPEVNRAIIQAHEQGVLTSTSLMVTGDAFQEAVELARSHPQLAVGLHLVLVCGRAALSPGTILHLTNDMGQFSNNPTQAGLRYQFDPAARQELQREIRAQLEKFRQTGLPLSHVDGHLHLHCHPVVLQILIDFADEFGIPLIRLPSEELDFTLKLDRSALFSKATGWWIFNQLRRHGERQLQSAGIGYVDKVYGLLRSGTITEPYLLGLIPQIQADIIEIYAHPAASTTGELGNDLLGSGAKELEALLSDKVRQSLTEQGFELTNFRELTKMEVLSPR